MKKIIDKLNLRILILIILIFSSCKSTKDLTDGYARYQFKFSKDIIESNNSNTKEKISKNNKRNYSLTFYSDSVRVDDFEGKRIFIPKEYKRIINRKIGE